MKFLWVASCNEVNASSSVTNLDPQGRAPEPCRNRSYLAPVTPPPRQEGQHKWLKPKQVVMHETTSYRHYIGAASMSGDVFYALHINC